MNDVFVVKIRTPIDIRAGDRICFPNFAPVPIERFSPNVTTLTVEQECFTVEYWQERNGPRYQALVRQKTGERQVLKRNDFNKVTFGEPG